MSILGCWVAPTKVIVHVDTLGGNGLAGAGGISKLFTFAHASTVLAGRGNVAFLGMVFMLLQPRVGLGFDDLEDEMPATLQAAIDLDTKALMRGPQNVLLAGYSRRHERMVARYWELDSSIGRIAKHLVEPAVIAPGRGGDGAFRGLPTFQDVAALARRQVAYAREEQPDWPVGGELICAEIARGTMTISTVCTL